MRIDSYNFGVMRIEGNEYTEDLIVYQGKINGNWFRRTSHTLDEEDLYDVFDYEPEVLIVGLGASTMMDIPPLTERAIRQRGITLIAADTQNACEKFNIESEKGKKVAGVFHLTC